SVLKGRRASGGQFHRAPTSGVQINNRSLSFVRLRAAMMSVLREPNKRRAVRILELVCAVVLCGTLVAGLKPFHAPQNNVTWLVGNRGLHISHFGTVLSSECFHFIP